MAQSGKDSDAKATTVFPPVIAGMMVETSPISDEFSGQITPTTPIGSRTEKLKCEEDTGFTELAIC